MIAMCQIRRKVSARTGAALLLALFYFLLCCVVGGITVTAASTNAVRMSRAKLDQQTYLAVRSAARTLIADLETTSLQGTFQVRSNRINWHGGVVGNEFHTCFPYSQLNGVFVNGRLADLLPEEDLKNLYLSTVEYASGGTSSYVRQKVSSSDSDWDGSPMAFTYRTPISVSFEMEVNGYPSIPPVVVTLTFGTASGKQMEAELTLKSRDGSYQMVFRSRVSRFRSPRTDPERIMSSEMDRTWFQQNTTVTDTFTWTNWEAVE